MELTAFFYDPNIHPFTEFQRRMETLERYLFLRPMDHLIVDDYELVPVIKAMIEAAGISGADQDEVGGSMTKEQRKRRCDLCYSMRLRRTALTAKEKGFDGFSTTMLLSKHQDHEAIKRIAKAESKAAGIEFVYKDLRKNWKLSLEESARYRLYRQPYCGCIFSEQERYLE